jgi:predicted MFS family arabinose efflux permease
MHRSPNPAAVLAVAVALTVVGSGTFNVLPLLTAGAMGTLGFSDRQIGLMSLTISVGLGAGAVFATMWVRSVEWPRAAAIALGGLFAANSLAMLVHGYWAFVLLQGAAGFCGSSVFCLTTTILSDRHESARSFGVSNAMQTTYQVAALLAGPTLLRLAGLNGVLAMLALPAGLAMLLTPLLPTYGRAVGAERLRHLLTPATVIALVGCGTFFANVGAYWTYIELIGQARGMTPRVVANCVAAGVSAGVLGGALAWVLGDRFGRLWPLCVAALLTIVAALLLHGSFSVLAFVVSAALYLFAWNYSLAYQLAIVNAVDATGRGVAITGAFCLLGSAAGAGITASLLTPGDYGAVIWIVIIAVSLSTALFAFSSAIQRHADARGGGAQGLSCL